MSIKQNQYDLCYPCPVCINADICRYKDDISGLLNQFSSINIGKAKFECSRYDNINHANKVNNINKVETKHSNTIDTVSEKDIENCKKIAELFDITVDSVRIIDKCPICGKKHKTAIKCDKCNRYVCINCIEAEDVYNNIDRKPKTQFTCSECNNGD